MQRIILDSALYPKVGNKQEYAYVYMLKLPTCMDGNNPTYKLPLDRSCLNQDQKRVLAIVITHYRKRERACTKYLYEALSPPRLRTAPKVDKKIIYTHLR